MVGMAALPVGARIFQRSLTFYLNLSNNYFVAQAATGCSFLAKRKEPKIRRGFYPLDPRRHLDTPSERCAFNGGQANKCGGEEVARLFCANLTELPRLKAAGLSCRGSSSPLPAPETRGGFQRDQGGPFGAFFGPFFSQKKGTHPLGRKLPVSLGWQAAKKLPASRKNRLFSKLQATPFHLPCRGGHWPSAAFVQAHVSLWTRNARPYERLTPARAGKYLPLPHRQ